GLELWRRLVAQLVSKSKSYLCPSWRLHGHADGDGQRRGDQPQDPVDSRDSATTAIAAIAGPLIDRIGNDTVRPEHPKMVGVPGSKIDPARRETEQVGAGSDKTCLVLLSQQKGFDVQVD